MIRPLSVLTFCLLLVAGLPAVGSARPNQDVILTARALGFLRDFDTDPVRLAVIRDPSSPQSVAEANEIRAAIGQGLRVAKIRLTLVDIRIDEIQSARNYDVVWLTKGLRDYERIVKLASERHILSVSTDLSCVENGHCVLGVQSQPSVKIVLGSAAALRAGIAFQPAFRMMVTER